MASTADASSRSKNYAGGYYASTDRILWLGDSDAAKNVVVWEDLDMPRQQFTCHTNTLLACKHICATTENNTTESPLQESTQHAT